MDYCRSLALGFLSGTSTRVKEAINSFGYGLDRRRSSSHKLSSLQIIGDDRFLHTAAAEELSVARKG